MAAALVFGPEKVSASVEYCKVIDVSGTAEILESGSALWRPLAVPKLLKAGDKVRALEKAYVEFSTGDDLSGLMKLGGNSEFEVMGEDLTRFFLRKGIFFILREEDGSIVGKQGKEQTLFQIFTKDLIVSFLGGGSSVSVNDKGTWVRVFSEHVRANPFDNVSTSEGVLRTVTEGFKFFMKAPPEPTVAGPMRMNFSDYSSWQFWMRQCYQRKDALSQKFLTKN